MKHLTSFLKKHALGFSSGALPFGALWLCHLFSASEGVTASVVWAATVTTVVLIALKIADLMVHQRWMVRAENKIRNRVLLYSAPIVLLTALTAYVLFPPALMYSLSDASSFCIGSATSCQNASFWDNLYFSMHALLETGLTDKALATHTAFIAMNTALARTYFVLVLGVIIGSIAASYSPAMTIEMAEKIKEKRLAEKSSLRQAKVDNKKRDLEQ